MASWYDKGDVGPDTDPNPLQGDGQLDDQHFLDTLFDGLEDDQFNQREPGLGTEYAGDDPSIWSIEGQAEEPEQWTVTNPAVLSSEGAEMLKGIREHNLLALRGIHIPQMDVPPGVDPATGEILFDDDAIPSFKESVAELEAILAEVQNADQPEEPVGTLADIPPELILQVMAEMEAAQGVVEQAVDTDANVASINPVLNAILTRADNIFSWLEDNWTGDKDWWRDEAKLKAFLGVRWDGFLNDDGGPSRQAFSITNPNWMSPEIKWDRNMPWWLQFESALPAPTYQWFTGDYGVSLSERLSGRGWTNLKVANDTGQNIDNTESDAAFIIAIDSEEDTMDEDPLSDSIYSALIAFSDEFITAPTDIIEFQIVDDTSTGAWDEGLL